MARTKLIYGRTTEEIAEKASEILIKEELTISQYLHLCLKALVAGSNLKKGKSQ